MQITQGNLEAVFTGLKATFAEAVETTENERILRMMEIVPSTSGTETYPVATLLGDLEEVLDEVTITNIGTFVQSVPNRTFARIVQVKRNDIADDNIGVYRPGVRQLGRRAALYPLRLAAEVLPAGFTDQWIDGTTIFSDSHEWVGGQSWSNRSDVALNAANFEAAVNALEGRVGPDAAPLGLEPDLLVCGLANKAAAEAILEVQYLEGGQSNRNYKKCELLVLSRFGAGEAWFVMDTDPVKPMILQDREGPEFTAKDSPEDDEAFYRERYAYKGRRRCAVAVLAPWLVQASDGG
ncbi:MAG: Mu-like prophage major head subunit gpT family protein [Candidatus Brocadiae bacterium]|nr:Mu-like prophage major head subunit gpT family protein [Candidatus Brocadiia bacterium]